MLASVTTETPRRAPSDGPKTLFVLDAVSEGVAAARVAHRREARARGARRPDEAAAPARVASGRVAASDAMLRLPRSRGRVRARVILSLDCTKILSRTCHACASSGGHKAGGIVFGGSFISGCARATATPRRSPEMSGYSLGDTSVKTTLKYGLNPAAKKKGPAGKAKKGPLKPALAAFAEDSDDDDAKDERERANAEILRQQQAARNAQKVRSPPHRRAPSTPRRAPHRGRQP